MNFNENEISQMKNICADLSVNEKMSAHTSFKIGGVADVFVNTNSVDEILNIIEHCKKTSIPYMVIGNGSNLLVSDKGIDGVVICIGKKFSKIIVDDNVITAECGALMSEIAAYAMNNELTGFEFAAGIPGTIGGGIYMNAGAYGGELKNVIEEVTYIDEFGKICVSKLDELDMSYRHSMFSDRNCAIVSCKIKLEGGKREDIVAKMKELAAKRREKQPLEYPSAGSTFKRPEGYFAGKLIQDSNLQGVSVGGAEVSTKHAGFVINKGNATADDVLNLIKTVQDRVYEQFGVKLEPEVKLIGR